MSQITDNPNCPKCGIEFQDKILFPCSHSITLCYDCLMELAGKSSFTISCLECQNEFTLNKSFIEILKRKTEKLEPNIVSVDKCSSCETRCIPSCFCTICSEWLCDTCVAAHQRVSITKNHTIKKISDMDKDEIPTLLTQFFCRIHKLEELKWFCLDCNTMTCRDCQLFTHRNHLYKEMTQVSVEEQEKFSSKLEDLKTIIPKIENVKNYLGDISDSTNEEMNCIISEIHKISFQYKDAIDRWREKMFDLAYQKLEPMQSILNQNLQKSKNLLANLYHSVAFMNQILTRNELIVFLESKDFYTGHINELLTRSKKIEKSKMDLPNPKFSVDSGDLNSFTNFLQKSAYLIESGLDGQKKYFTASEQETETSNLSLPKNCHYVINQNDGLPICSSEQENNVLSLTDDDDDDDSSKAKKKKLENESSTANDPTTEVRDSDVHLVSLSMKIGQLEMTGASIYVSVDNFHLNLGSQVEEKMSNLTVSYRECKKVHYYLSEAATVILMFLKDDAQNEFLRKISKDKENLPDTISVILDEFKNDEGQQLRTLFQKAAFKYRGVCEFEEVSYSKVNTYLVLQTVK